MEERARLFPGLLPGPRRPRSRSRGSRLGAQARDQSGRVSTLGKRPVTPRLPFGSSSPAWTHRGQTPRRENTPLSREGARSEEGRRLVHARLKSLRTG